MTLKTNFDEQITITTFNEVQEYANENDLTFEEFLQEALKALKEN